MKKKIQNGIYGFVGHHNNDEHDIDEENIFQYLQDWWGPSLSMKHHLEPQCLAMRLLLKGRHK